MEDKNQIKAKQIYNKLDPKTQTFTVRVSKQKLKKIDDDVKRFDFPSRAAWMEQAIDNFLGDFY